jgi:hypothetical protein
MSILGGHGADYIDPYTQKMDKGGRNEDSGKGNSEKKRQPGNIFHPKKPSMGLLLMQARFRQSPGRMDLLFFSHFLRIFCSSMRRKAALLCRKKLRLSRQPQVARVPPRPPAAAALPSLR